MKEDIQTGMLPEEVAQKYDLSQEFIKAIKNNVGSEQVREQANQYIRTSINSKSDEEVIDVGVLDYEQGSKILNQVLEYIETADPRLMNSKDNPILSDLLNSIHLFSKYANIMELLHD